MKQQIFYILAVACCSVLANTNGDSYETLDSYTATDEHYLSYKVGEIITLIATNVESQWLGELHGSYGLLDQTQVRRSTYEVIVNRTFLSEEDPNNRDNHYLDLVMGDIVEVVEKEAVVKGVWVAKHKDIRGFILPTEIVPAIYESQYNQVDTNPEYLKVKYGDFVSVTDKTQAHLGFIMAELNGDQGRVFINGIDKPTYIAKYKLETNNKEDISFRATDLMVLSTKSAGGDERVGWWWANTMDKDVLKSGFVPEVYMHKSTLIALMDCLSTEPLELELVVRDRVQLIRKLEGTHWLGVLEGKIGYFDYTCCREE